MRKSFFLVLTLAMATLVFSQSIDNVRIVPSQTRYSAGSAATIRWNYSGIGDSELVKITLWRQGAEQSTCLIADNVRISDMSRDWTIPLICTNPHSGATEDLKTSQVKLRVRWKGHPVWSESRLFSIVIGLNIPGRPLVMRDLELKDLYYNPRTFGGGIVLTIKNHYNTFNGNITALLTFSTPIRGSRTHRITKHLNLRPEAQVNLFFFELPPGDVPDTGLRVTAALDPDNDIGETNEDNNTLEKTIDAKLVDLSCSSPRSELKLYKTYLKSSYKWRITLKLHARAQGTGYTEVTSIPVGIRLYKDEAGSGELYYDRIVVPSIRRGEEYIKSLEYKFGHPDLRRSRRPRLEEGNYYLLIEVDPGNSTNDINRANNTCRLSFTLR